MEENDRVCYNFPPCPCSLREKWMFGLFPGQNWAFCPFATEKAPCQNWTAHHQLCIPLHAEICLNVSYMCFVDECVCVCVVAVFGTGVSDCVVIPTRLSMHVATAKTVTETVTSARAHAAAARLFLAFSPQQTNSNTPFAPPPPTRLSARVAAPDTTRARQGPHRCRRNRL